MAAIFVVLTVIIIAVEAVSPNVHPDYSGIIVWPFMLGWVAATVANLPIVNVPLFPYLLLKSSPGANRRVDYELNPLIVSLPGQVCVPLR